MQPEFPLCDPSIVQPILDDRAGDRFRADSSPAVDENEIQDFGAAEAAVFAEIDGFGERAVQAIRDHSSYAEELLDPSLAEDGFEGDRRFGAKNVALLKLIGSAVACCFDVEGATPDHVYALLHPVVSKIQEAHERDGDGSKDFHAEARRMLARAWSEHAAKSDSADTVADECRARFAVGLRKWPRRVLRKMLGQSGRLRSVTDDELIDAFLAWSLGILVTPNGRDHYIVGPDASYRRHSVASTRLRADIVRDDMQWLMPVQEVVRKRDGQGNEVESFRKLTTPNILERYSRTIGEGVVLAAEGGPNYFGIGFYGEGSLTVQQPGLRTDIEPRFDARVDEWLRALVEPECWDDFEYSIGAMLAFQDGPMPALLLLSPAGTGKKMLATGLAECCEGPGQPATGQALSSNFNAELLHSPFVHIDEGFAGGRNGVQVHDTFRSIVAGERLRIEPKGKDPIRAANAHRVLLTVNNADTIDRLAGDGWRSEDDAQAIADRLLIFSICDDAAKLLKQRGGLDHTRGWVAPDNAGVEASDLVVARHLLHLHRKLPRDADGRVIRRGSRFLIDGNAHTEVRATVLDSGIAPDVARAIDEILDGPQPGVVVEGGTVWVTASAVHERLHVRGMSTTPVDTRRALKRMANIIGEAPRRRVAGVRQRWIGFEPAHLLELVARVAAPSKTLQRLVDQTHDQPHDQTHDDQA